MIHKLLLAAVVVGLAVTPAQARPLPLSPYLEEVVPGLVTLDIEIDGQHATMLFDSGAGATFVTPAFAARIGCTPYGSATGFRMRGDRLDGQKCGARRLTIGGRDTVREIGELDLAGLLPTGAQPIDGIVGLDAFEGRLVVIDMANRRLIVDERPGRGWTEGRVRYQREMGGAGLSLFVPIAAPTGTLWMLLDTGHVGETPIFLSAGALQQLGAPPLGQALELDISGAGRQSGPAAKIDGLIYDGVLGERLLRRFDIAVDLSSSRIWWRPHQAGRP